VGTISDVSVAGPIPVPVDLPVISLLPNIFKSTRHDRIAIGAAFDFIEHLTFLHKCSVNFSLNYVPRWLPAIKWFLFEEGFGEACAKLQRDHDVAIGILSDSGKGHDAGEEFVFVAHAAEPSANPPKLSTIAKPG
jgi:hypothetical protein